MSGVKHHSDWQADLFFRILITTRDADFIVIVLIKKNIVNPSVTANIFIFVGCNKKRLFF